MHLELVHTRPEPEPNRRPSGGPGAGAAPAVQLPPGPVTRAELDALCDAATIRRHYAPLWRGMYRSREQADDLGLRNRALAAQFPEGVLCGRSAALAWGDDSQTGLVAEICLPERRGPLSGRRFRHARLPDGAVAERDGLPVTGLLRTCLDLARWIKDHPNGYGRPEDLVVTLDRLSAAYPELPGLLHAYLTHPSAETSRASLGRLAWALSRSEPGSPSAEASRARLVLHDAGLTGFAHGHVIGAGRGAVRPMLADPDARVLVEVAGAGHEPPPAEPDSPRAAGWTTVVAYHGCPWDPAQPCAYDPVAASDVALRTARALRTSWPDVEIHLPLDPRVSVLDPSGYWTPGPSLGGGDYFSGADGSAW